MKTADETINEMIREKRREACHIYYARHREEILAKRKERYKNDPEYRRRLCEYGKRHYLEDVFKRGSKHGTA